MCSHQRSRWRAAVAIQVGKPGQRREVDQKQPSLSQAKQATPLQLAQGLVGVGQRQAQSISQVLLGGRENHTLARLLGVAAECGSPLVKQDCDSHRRPMRDPRRGVSARTSYKAAICEITSLPQAIGPTLLHAHA